MIRTLLLRRLPIMIALALALGLTTASFPAAALGQNQTIKIVSSLPRTGSAKGQTDTIVNSIQLALSEINNRVGSFTIVYEDLDDATAAKGSWDAGKEAENANRAINDSQVVAYIGTFNSGAAKVSIPILCKSNLVMVSPANTYPGLTKNVPGVDQGEPDLYYANCQRNYTRVVPSDELQGAAGANWARQLGAQRVYVLDDTELYGHGIAVMFANMAQQIGLQVVGGPEGIDSKASDYRALAEKVRGANPDLVYFGGITQNNAGKLWLDIRAVMPQVKMMGPDGILEKAFIDAAGPAGESTLITFGGVGPSKLTGKGAAWYQAYKGKFNAEPEAYAAYGYEATKVVLNAIARAGTADRAAIRDAVFATSNFDGVLGQWSFDANGDTSLTQMSGRQVSGGKFDEDNAVILSTSSAQRPGPALGTSDDMMPSDTVGDDTGM